MSLTGLNNVNGQAALPPERLMEKIRTTSNEINTMFEQKNAEGSAIASNRTKEISQEAFKVSLRSDKLAQGAFYAKPR